MAIDLLRIDERLIHGQVAVGWGARLGVERYLVVDDALVDVEWERELYASAAAPGVETRFLTTAEAADGFETLDGDPRKTALLTKGTAAMRVLAERGALEGRRVNVGGLHAGEGRRRFVDYVSLSPDEIEDLRAIVAAGARVFARDLPTSAPIPLDELLSE